MSYIKDISLFLVIAFFTNLTSHLIGTDFLLIYLKSNLTTVQLGLLAINTATCGLVVSKLQEIKEKHVGINIKPITKQLLLSLKEQIFLIIIGVMLMLLIDSNLFNQLSYCEYIKFALETLLMAVFVNSVQVLWDTGKSVFVLTDILDDVGNND
ncbi:MAG: hypothetical protein H7239_01105 [Flavobacterium sp.]|nr:hypothetical protein [Flavobacterium sp.]